MSVGQIILSYVTQVSQDFVPIQFAHLQIQSDRLCYYVAT